MNTIRRNSYPWRALLLLVTSMTLFGCLTGDSGEPDPQILGARWVSGDSVFVFSVQDREPDSKTQRVRIFVGTTDSARRNLTNMEAYVQDFAFGCRDLRTQDSLVFMTYYSHPAEKSADQVGCPSTRHGSRILAGHLGLSFFSPVSPAPDTGALRATLTANDPILPPRFDEGFEERGNPYSGWTICLDNGGPCLDDLVKDWDLP